MFKSKKILFVVGGSAVFGAEIAMLNVIAGLHSHGYEIRCVVSGWNNGDFLKRLQGLDITCYVVKLGYFYLSKPMWTIDTLVHLPGAWFKYWQTQTRFQPDIIYHLSFRSILMLFPFLGQGKTILHVQDYVGINKANCISHRIIDKKVSRYIACSDFIKNHLREYGINPEKIKVILNGTNLRGASVRNIIKVEKSRFPVRIGIVGQVRPHKGHLDLIEALNILKEKGFSLTLKIFGEGDIEYIKILKNKISQYCLTENVEWMGYVKNQEDIYSGIDIAIVPSRLDDPCPLAAIEPALFGIPVVASKKGGIPEIVLDNETGLLFEAGNYYDLSSKIELLINNPDLLIRLVSNAKVRFEKKFTAEIMCEQVEEIL